MIVRFHVLSPPSKQRSFAARLPLLIGRGEEANFRIQHDLVSRRHCELFIRDGQVFIHDLGSTNGTFLDDEQVLVSTKTAVPPGGVVRVGGLTFRVDYQPATGGVVPAAPTRAGGGDRGDEVDDQDAAQSRVAGVSENAAEEPPDFDFVAPENTETEPLVAAEAAARESAVAAPFPPPEAVGVGEPPAGGPVIAFTLPDGEPPAAAPWAAVDAPQADAPEDGADSGSAEADGPDDDKFNEFLKGLR